MKKKEPRFFCDKCGAEVPISVKKCPDCGAFFASILCPVCGFSGGDDQFKYGCPACGYSLSSENSSGRRPPRTRVRIKPKHKTKAIPLWLYILGGAIVTALLAELLAYYFF
jgi:uncharacterized membrane protein YvbJ